MFMARTTPIFKLRAKAGLSQIQLARKAEVALQVIRRLEDGYPLARITPERARVAQVLGCTQADLIPEEPASPKPTVDVLDAFAELYNIPVEELRQGTSEHALRVKAHLKGVLEDAKNLKPNQVALVKREPFAKAGARD
jgi:transcriptional regulator with XRE-family HTH domain